MIWVDFQAVKASAGFRAGARLWLLKSPFLLRQLMLRPTMDTLLGDDVSAAFRSS
jgi:hypothetical protein